MTTPPPMFSFRWRFWRILAPRRASEPLSGGGAAKRGGRWNEPGTHAIYLSEQHATAIAEYMQDLKWPGLLIPYNVTAERLVDLRAPEVRIGLSVPEAMLRPWKTITRTWRRRAPTWDIAAALAADGVRATSLQRPARVNFVLWRWNQDVGVTRVRAIDPTSEHD